MSTTKHGKKVPGKAERSKHITKDERAVRKSQAQTQPKMVMRVVNGHGRMEKV